MQSSIETYEAGTGKLLKRVEFDIDPEIVKQLAKKELVASDGVALRCVKAGVPYPEDWNDRDNALRDMVRTGQGDMPDKLEYPEGT